MLSVNGVLFNCCIQIIVLYVLDHVSSTLVFCISELCCTIEVSKSVNLLVGYIFCFETGFEALQAHQVLLMWVCTS